MKALHLIKTTIGATWALKEIEVLISLGCSVHVVLPSNTGLASKYSSAGAIVHVVNFNFMTGNLLRVLAELIKLRKLVSEIKPDIIHSHFVGTTLFMRMAMIFCKIPRVFQVPGPLHLENKLTRSVEILSANSSDYWIATCARTSRYYLEAGVASARIRTIFYGTDVSLFSADVNESLRNELGLGPDVAIIGMVAYVYPPKRWLGQRRGIKGHEDLIDAVALVLKHRPNTVCVFVGGAWGDSRQYFEEVVRYSSKELGAKGIFLGSRNDVARIYGGFDLVVHPSHSENLGGAGESLLMAVPTLATNVGGFPDIVVDGLTGWLVEPGDPEEMAIKIQEVLSDPVEARKRANAGRALVLESLDVKKTGEKVLEFYSEIIGRENA